MVEVQEALTHQGEVTVPETGEAVAAGSQLYVLVRADCQQVQLQAHHIGRTKILKLPLVAHCFSVKILRLSPSLVAHC